MDAKGCESRRIGGGTACLWGMLHAVRMTWIGKQTHSHITCGTHSNHVFFGHIVCKSSTIYTRDKLTCTIQIFHQSFNVRAESEDPASGMVPSSVSWQVSPSPLQGMLGTSAVGWSLLAGGSGQFWQPKARNTLFYPFFQILSMLFILTSLQSAMVYGAKGTLAVCAKMLAAILSPKAAMTPCIRLKVNDCERLQELLVGWFGKMPIFPSGTLGRKVCWMGFLEGCCT